MSDSAWFLLPKKQLSVTEKILKIKKKKKKTYFELVTYTFV